MPKKAKHILKIEAFIVPNSPTGKKLGLFGLVSDDSTIFRVALRSKVTYKGKVIKGNMDLPYINLSANPDSTNPECVFRLDKICEHNCHLSQFYSFEAAEAYIKDIELRIKLALDHHNSVAGA